MPSGHRSQLGLSKFFHTSGKVLARRGSNSHSHYGYSSPWLRHLFESSRFSFEPFWWVKCTQKRNGQPGPAGGVLPARRVCAGGSSDGSTSGLFASDDREIGIDKGSLRAIELAPANQWRRHPLCGRSSKIRASKRWFPEDPFPSTASANHLLSVPVIRTRGF